MLIGGIKDNSQMNKRFTMIKGLKGAIQRIKINKVSRKDLRINAIELSDIKAFEGYPCNHKLCKNDAMCRPFLNKFKCTFEQHVF